MAFLDHKESNHPQDQARRRSHENRARERAEGEKQGEEGGVMSVRRGDM